MAGLRQIVSWEGVVDVKCSRVSTTAPYRQVGISIRMSTDRVDIDSALDRLLSPFLFLSHKLFFIDSFLDCRFTWLRRLSGFALLKSLRQQGFQLSYGRGFIFGLCSFVLGGEYQ